MYQGSFATRRLAVLLALVLTTSCGGGGSGGSSPAPNPNPPPSAPNPPAPPPATGIPWSLGVFQPASSFAARCAAPRPGSTDLPGSTLEEKHWLRSWTHELYLWYAEVPDRNPALTADVLQYFDLLQSPTKDRFHFALDTEEFLAQSQSGVSVAYGVRWEVLQPAPPRRIVVAFVEPGSPAAAPSASLVRGAEVLRVDGVDAVNDGTQAGVDTLIAGLSPTVEGETHSFRIRDPSGTTRDISLQAARITSNPVPLVRTLSTPTGTVGYLLFNAHIATAERELVDAVNALKADNIQDLVLDIRYNGGGFLGIASELAYMIGGTPTAGRVFERLQFNDKHPTTNPVTGEPLVPAPFATTTLDFSLPPGQALPTRALPRVFVLTGPDTCSASESIMNGLRGVGVEVIQIGSTTCGKPYGFYPADNCGTTYFSIQFKGVNEQGFGEYADGFSPANTIGGAPPLVPGCSVADDFSAALGDVIENRLEAALAYRAGQGCPAPSGSAPVAIPLQKSGGDIERLILRSPALENRILRE
jgi:carboxyl-terminal processing protease